MIFCPNCGKQIAGNSKFCPKCGYKIAKVTGKSAARRGIGLKSMIRHAFAKHRVLKLCGVGAVVVLLALGGGYKYYSAHFLPLGIANHSITMSNEYTKGHYDFHYRTFTFKMTDEPKETYAVEHVSKTDGGHKANVDVEGLNKHSQASSFTFNQFHNEISAVPHGEY